MLFIGIESFCLCFLPGRDDWQGEAAECFAPEHNRPLASAASLSVCSLWVFQDTPVAEDYSLSSLSVGICVSSVSSLVDVGMHVVAS
jgi:hypothetical protein